MALQMVYTSVRSGLVAGRSGFCTAARHKDLKESLVARLEDFSAQYDRGIGGGAAESQLPVIYQYRIITIREDRYHVLMRLGDAGNDYSGRTNHIAHSLVLDPVEVAGLQLNPAEVILGLSRRGFWRTRYDEPARYFGNEESISLSSLSPVASLPAARWSSCTGSPANAAQLFDSNRPVDAGVVLTGPGEADGEALLGLFAESLLLLEPERSNPANLWSVPFTTVLQSSIEKSHFRWCGILRSGTLLHQEARSGRKIITLGNPLSAPTGLLAEIAQGLSPNLISVTQASEELPLYRTIPLPSEAPKPSQGTFEAFESVADTATHQAVEPQVFIPISIEDPRRAKRTERKSHGRTLALIAGIAILIIGLVVAGLWYKGRDVRGAEAEVRALVDNGQWQEVRKVYTGNRINEDLKSRSTELANWDAASKAIDRFAQIKSSPHEFSKIVRGKDSIEDAITTIKEEWAAGYKKADANLEEQVTSAEKGAQNSAKAWNASVKSLTEAWDAAGRRFELKEVRPADAVEKQIIEFEETIKKLKADAPETAEPLEKLFQILTGNVTPAIDELRGIKKDYDDQMALEDAKKRVANQVSTLNLQLNEIGNLEKSLQATTETGSLHEKAETTCRNLYTKLEGLPHGLKLKDVVSETTTAAPPKPNPPASENGKSAAQKENSIPRTYIVLKTSEGEVDLSKVSEIEAGLPLHFSILPLSKIDEPGQVTSLSQGKVKIILPSNGIYSEAERSLMLFTGAKSRILKIEKGGEKFWADFPGGFVIRFPKPETPASTVQIAVIDVPAAKTGNLDPPIAEHLFALSLPDFLERSDDGDITLAKGALEITESLDFPGEAKPLFELIFSEKEARLSSKETSAADLRISILANIANEILITENKIKNFESYASASKNFESNYGQLGQKLFPEFFSADGIQTLAVQRPPLGSKDKDFWIGKSHPNNPPARGVNPIPAKTLQDFRGSEKNPLGQDFREYVESLFETLDELAGESSRLKSGNGHIQRFIKNSEDLKETNGDHPVLFGWIELGKISVAEKWSLPKGADPSDGKFGDKSKADEALENYRAEKYFSDFFKAWEELFSEEEAKELFAYLSRPPEPQGVSDPQTLQSKLKELNALKSRFENATLSDDGVYSLNLVYEFENRNSDAKILQIIPLIKGIPAEN